MWRRGVGMKITLHLICPQVTLAQDSPDRDSTQFHSRCHSLHLYVVLGYMSIGDLGYMSVGDLGYMSVEDLIHLKVLTENRGEFCSFVHRVI
jgi:hypothetical protein